MKTKLIYSFATLGLFLALNSCSHEDTTPAQEVSAMDADGASGGYIFNQEGHSAGTTFVIIAVNSSVASAIQGLQNTFFPKMQQQTGQLPEPLPSTLLVPNNPYEKYGILHNRCLNVIAQNGGITKTLNDLSAYDPAVYNKFFDAAADLVQITDAEKASFLTDFKANNSVDLIKSRTSQITGLNSSNKMIEFIGLPVPETNTLKNIRTNCKSLEDEQKPKEEICKYLNAEISKILGYKKALTHQEETEVVYLTIFKHSIYYWN